MKKKRVFSLLSMIVAMFMIVIQLTSINVQAADSKEIEPITVTLNAQLRDGTLILPKELKVSYCKFSDLGLNITNDDPKVITPLHVLAEYYKEVKHVTKEDMTKYIDVSKEGYLNKIEDLNGSSNKESTSDFWMFAVNNKLVADSNGMGYSVTEAPLSEGDKVTFFGENYPETEYYSAFEKDEYETLANIEVSVSLKTLSLSDYNKEPSTEYDITGATIKAYNLDKNGKLSELKDGIDYEVKSTFNSDGNASLLFKNEGTYYLSAEKIDTSKNYNVISRPITKVVVYKEASELPDYKAFWGSAKQDVTNNSTVNAYTPRNADEIDKEASWNVNLREGKTGWGKWTYPIVVNKNIYIAVDKELYKYDLNGKLLGQGELSSTVLGSGFTGWLAYGDGMIFVPLGAGSVEAFNADDLTPLWKSEPMGPYSQTSSPLLYKDGYLYTGVTNGSKAGAYGCIKTSDDDKTTGYEVKSPVWVFNDNDTNPSFYWAGAAICGDYLVVPCDTGKVYSIDIKESINKKEAVVVDTYTANDKIRTSINYDKDSESIYFPTGTNGTLYKIGFNEETGKFKDAKTAELGKQSNCAPVIYKNRLYVSSLNGIHVFDKNTLKQIYLAESEDMGKGKKNIRHLSLSTAYAKESNNYEVYLYGYDYDTPGIVSVLKDNQKMEDSTVQLLHENTESPQYSTSNIVIADDGSLLYVNDSNHLFCLKSKVQKEEAESNVTVKYSSQVQKLGWQKEVSNGETSGTEGKGLRLEGIKINVSGDNDLGVSYSAYVEKLGWQKEVSDGTLAGTEGKGLRLEAIKINLTGKNASNYDIYYRVHVQGNGWLDWAKNNEVAGTLGLAKRVEAIEIKLVKKGDKAPGPTGNSSIYKKPEVSYKSHVQSIGWQNPVTDGKTSGTVGKSKRIEAISANVSSLQYAGGIKYRAHVQKQGWQNPVENGVIAGTEGKGLRLEAVQYVLTGELAKHYDVYYRVHVQNIGWMNWAKNGEAAGTSGYGYRIEAIEIKLVKKGDKAPGAVGNSYKDKNSKTVHDLSENL